MKKVILIICLFTFFVVGNGQNYKSFGWSDADLSLYYTTGQSLFSGFYYTNQILNVDTCFLVFPKEITRSSCYNNGNWLGLALAPYSGCEYINLGPNYSWFYYQKPKGNLHIPYYNVLITNSIPKYREIIGIGERTFYNCDSLTKITIPSTIKRIEELFIYGCSMLDTVVFENTFNEDTVYPPQMTDYTWFIETPLTIVVPCNSYDTFYNYIHSLGTPQMVQLNIVPDNICDCGAYVIDTIQVYDTTQVVETIYDTVLVYDTVITNIMNIHHVYDTVTIYDTVTYTQYFMYYDTTLIVVYDTMVINVYDTVYETIYDTILVFKQVDDLFDDLRLYPVPTKDYVNVDYNGYLEYQLYNSNGKFLERGTIISHDILNLTRYASGEYYFKAKLDNGEIITKKIVKMSI